MNSIDKAMDKVLNFINGGIDAISNGLVYVQFVLFSIIAVAIVIYVGYLLLGYLL